MLYKKQLDIVSVFIFEPSSDGSTFATLEQEVRDAGGHAQLDANDQVTISINGKTNTVPLGMALVVDGSAQYVWPVSKIHAEFGPVVTEDKGGKKAKPADMAKLTELESKVQVLETEKAELESRIQALEAKAAEPTPQPKADDTETPVDGDA